jgi:hypothetical protein
MVPAVLLALQPQTQGQRGDDRGQAAVVVETIIYVRQTVRR